MRVEKWDTKVLRMTVRPRMKVGEGWVDYRKKLRKRCESNMAKDETANDDRKKCREGVEDHGLDHLRR